MKKNYKTNIDLHLHSEKFQPQKRTIASSVVIDSSTKNREDPPNQNAILSEIHQQHESRFVKKVKISSSVTNDAPSDKSKKQKYSRRQSKRRLSKEYKKEIEVIIFFHQKIHLPRLLK